MEVIEVLPQLNPTAIFPLPTFLAIESGVVLRMGGNVCLLALNDCKRYNQHGTFHVVELENGSAKLEVTVPRKGWNPGGRKVHPKVLLPPLTVVTFYRGKMHLRPVGDAELQWCREKTVSSPAAPRHRRRMRIRTHVRQ